MTGNDEKAWLRMVEIPHQRARAAALKIMSTKELIDTLDRNRKVPNMVHLCDAIELELENRL